MLAGKDKETRKKVPELNVSVKPQKITPKSECSVRELFHNKLKGRYNNA
jgi:ATP-binding cassette subfamily E protein 1